MAANADVDKHNPIGKIPALSVKGMDLFNSPVICEYLDSQHKGRKLLPRKGRDRWVALRQQAMGDGLLDAALLARYEGALRPEDKRWPDWSQGPDQEDRRRARPARGRGPSRSRASRPSAPSRSPARWAISTSASPTTDWRAKRPKLAKWFTRLLQAAVDEGDGAAAGLSRTA